MDTAVFQKSRQKPMKFWWLVGLNELRLWYKFQPYPIIYCWVIGDIAHLSTRSRSTKEMSWHYRFFQKVGNFYNIWVNREFHSLQTGYILVPSKNWSVELVEGKHQKINVLWKNRFWCVHRISVIQACRKIKLPQKQSHSLRYLP